MSMTTILITAVLAAAPDQGTEPALPRGMQKTFESLVRAYYAGDSGAVWKELSPMVARWSDTQVETLDRALAAQEVPGVGELLVELRMNLVQQNLANALPDPQIRERMLVLAALRDRTAAILEEHRTHPLVAGTSEAPESLVEYERLLWEIHVLRNKLLTAARATQYAQLLADGVTERIRERLKADELILLANAGEPLPDVQAAAATLDELDAEVRLKRLDHGLAALEQPQLSEERFMAAWSTQHDAEVVTAFLRNQAQGEGPRRLTRTALARPELIEEIAAKSERARQLAGDLAEKARNLFEGLHWWRRGRFGQGPELGGLAKSAAAAQTPDGLLWLYMPAEPPLPDPARDDTETPGETESDAPSPELTAFEFNTPSDRVRVRRPTPPVERRHHYTWAWEDRRIIPTSSSDGGDHTLGLSPLRGQLSTFW
jgi:hypothetical protein